MIPAETLSIPIGGHSSLPGGNRNTHATRVKAGSLNKITYPTGGYTVFELEANRATDTRAGQNVVVGGLRVKKISDFDPINSAPTVVREYEYLLENSTMTSGKLGIFPVYSHPVFYDYELPVWPIAVDYSPGQPNQIMRSTSPIHEIAYANGSPVNYTRVVEKTFNAGGYEGRTVSNFSAFTEASVTILKPFPYVPPDFKQWIYGLMLSEEVYGKNNNLLKKTVNEYDFPADNYFSNPARQANFRSITIAPVEYLYYGIRRTYLDDYWTNQGDPVFFLSEGYLPPAGRSELKKKTVYEYNGANSMVTENTYVYNQDYYNLKSETLKNSKGENITKNYLQPFDMVSLSRDPTGVYQAMVGRNIISPVVELTEQKNTTQTYLVRNNYSNPHTGVYVPQTVVTKKSSSPEDIVYRYETYDSKGKPLTVSKAAWGSKTSFIWGYNGQFPIAEARNASQNQISYTSFETNEKGGWTYSGAPVIAADSKTGRKYYNLGTGNITKSATGATTAAPYKLSLWVKRSSGTGTWTFMNKTENLTTAWQLVERTVTTATVTISGSGIYVDELRLHPAGAQMTTYTYDPVNGITSSTDSRNRTTYYEYDGRARLKNIRNEDKHILEHYEYHFTTGN
jgi:YD repeat-containing protein